ncbi:hypothetical protein [Hoylesella saccharolytica]|uniref:hypothetical protein n=1 Tax=Hoylesella saccharolytica TaxID=633701 RepID=UPI000471708B|nr:hypothetical protein [Hoylesella saccharolytica]
MKQIFIKLGMIAVGFTLLAACSKENNDNDTESKEQTQYLVFSMNEAPYNDEVEMAGTRGNATEIIKDTLLLNGVEAEVTLERDKEQLQQPATRAITSENHYTIVAFKTGTSTEVASTKGYFDATGVFKYDIGSGMMKILRVVTTLFATLINTSHVRETPLPSHKPMLTKPLLLGK